MNTLNHHIARLLAALSLMFALTSISTSANAADPLANYYGNTLFCQNQETQAKCWLWLEPDGNYYAFYYLGRPDSAPAINGPFTVNGRDGTYTLRGDKENYELCLWPAAPRIKINAEQQQEIFAGDGCYPFEIKKVGSKWDGADLVGRQVRFWLMEGR